MTSIDVVKMVIGGGALIAIELTRSLPAWLRVRRKRRTDGISPLSIGVLAGTSPGWIAVAVLSMSYAAAIATIIWLVFHLLLMKEVMAVSRRLSRTIILTSVISTLVVILATMVGLIIGDIATILGITIAFASAAYSLPALITGMTSKSTAGLSLISLSTNALEGAIYFCAGMGWGGIAPPGQHIVAYLLFGGSALLSNVPRLARTALRRLAGKDSLPGPADQEQPASR
jgi:uncharacterized protein with PQ loop repeat